MIFAVSEIVEFADDIKTTILKSARYAVEDMEGELDKLKGCNSAKEITSEDVDRLMRALTVTQIATLAKPPSTDVSHALVILQYSAMAHINTRLTQQAMKLGKATAKIDRLETEIAGLKHKEPRADHLG